MMIPYPWSSAAGCFSWRQGSTSIDFPRAPVGGSPLREKGLEVSWTKRIALFWLLASVVVSSAGAGDWRLQLGEYSLEGISASGAVAGGVYHLSLASDLAVLRFSFPAPGDVRPERASAQRVSITAFDPVLACAAPGESGLILDGDRLSGQVDCSEPRGAMRVDGEFNAD